MRFLRVFRSILQAYQSPLALPPVPFAGACPTTISTNTVDEPIGSATRSDSLSRLAGASSNFEAIITSSTCLALLAPGPLESSSRGGGCADIKVTLRQAASLTRRNAAYL